MSDQYKTEPFRNHELLDGLWEMGVTHYPQLGEFWDLYSESLEEAEGHNSLEDVKAGKLTKLTDEVQAYGESRAAGALGVGVPTLRDVVSELQKPGRYLRDSLPQPILRTDVMDLKDLQPGMVLSGTVRNVIDFGAFVDIGVHQDGLVHISEIADRYIKHPS